MSGKQFTPVALYIGAAPSAFGIGQTNRSMDPLSPIDKFEPTAQFDNAELLESLSTIQKTVEAQAKKIENMKKLLETQNQTLLSHGLMLKGIAGKRVNPSGQSASIPDVTELQLFPLDSLAALEAVENNLDNIPYDDLFSYIKSCIRGKAIGKCINIIFTTEFLISVNWDGAQGKTALKRFKLFTVHIYDAFHSEQNGLSFKDYQTELKHGLKMAKNRYYKSMSVQRNSLVKNEKSARLAMERESSSDD